MGGDMSFPRIGAVLGIAVITVLGAASAGTAIAPDTLIQLSSPSGNIGCLATNMDGPFSLRCDVANPLYTRPPRPASCPLDYGGYGDSFTLGARGRAGWTCHGDTALRAGQSGFRTLRYGTTWSWGPFRCTMRVTGIACTNTRGFGFRLSRQQAVRTG